jgi:4-diphosphocytidyl-2-C-methyl-D-erythritol kinase
LIRIALSRAVKLLYGSSRFAFSNSSAPLPQILTERAPAKINLTLHITGRRADGFHTVESLVAFSRAGDTVSLAPGKALTLSVEGPSAAASGRVEDNLILCAARHFAERVPAADLGAFHLVKRLPVAAGMGGGSSDAAAALRLLARANALSFDDPTLMEAAKATGADVPVCLSRGARVMRGIGDELGPLLTLAPLVALLVNPGVALGTRQVFARLNIAPGAPAGFGAHPVIGPKLEADALIAALRRGRNDMEAAACLLAPVVGDVLAILSAAPGCRLARMSGSGATCFALFRDCRSAARARKSILRAHPAWWTKLCALR